MPDKVDISHFDSSEVYDMESRLTEDHHQALRLWLRMLSCTIRIESEIRGKLRTEFDITLPRFDLMAQLECYPQGLRMGELSRRLMVTGGNVTGITDQLQQENLVERVLDPSDGRAYCVRLTPSGRRVFRKMARLHEGWVSNLFDGISSSEKEKLIKLLSRLKQYLNGKTFIKVSKRR